MVLLTIVLGLAFVVARQDQRGTDQAAQKAAELHKAGAPAEPYEQHAQENVQNPDGNGPRWYFVLFLGLFRWPVGTGTWVIVLTLLAVAEQARETAKATQAVRDTIPLQRDAASAALLNAKAVINSERPWVIIFAANTKRGAFFRAGNLGRTPAEIVSFSSEYKCVEHLGELPTEPEFTIEYVPQIKLLVPGKKFGESQDIELLSEEQFIDFVDGCRKESGYRSIPAPPKMSVFYFRVRYTHAGERLLPEIPPYESRACFCYHPADAGEPLGTCGNKSYNSYT